MEKSSVSLPNNRAIISLAIIILVVSSLVWSGFSNHKLYLFLCGVFILLAEFASFVIAWAGRVYSQDRSVFWFGSILLLIGVLDLGHIMTGMSIIGTITSENQSAQFWLAGRALHSFVLLTIPFFAGRKINTSLQWMGISLLITILIAGLIMDGKIIPVSYLSSIGYTPFFQLSGYVLAAVSALAFWLIYKRRPSINALFFRWLMLSIGAACIGTVLSAVSHFPSDGSMLLSHFLIVVGFAFTLKGLVETGITQPFEILDDDINLTRSRLQEETNFISAIFDTTSVLLVIINEQKMISQVNRVTETMTGYAQHEIKNRFAWETMLFSSNPEGVQSALDIVFKEENSTTYEGVIVDRDDNQRHIAWTLTRLPGPKDANYIVCTGVDMTERKQTEDELRFVSTHDVLTGLYNRSFFEAEILRIAETDHFPTSIVIADVDGLKMINDTFGHVVGDVWLQRAANALRSAFRSEDIVARIGGDEFAVLLTDADETVADHAQRRVREILAAHNLQNPGYKISISLGSATAEAGYMLMETYKKADQAMYREKASHQNRLRKPHKLSRR